MEYLQHVWYCSALGTEVTATPLARLICDKPIVLYRGQSGKVVALEDRCAHRQAPLSLGRVQGDDIECGYHGYVFDCSGVCVHVPHQDIVPKAAVIASYPAVERWGYIWLWLGDPAKADPATVPHLPWTEDKKLRTVYFRFDVNANFQLMADNLMDVSHTDFLHRSSIGSQTGRRGQNEEAKVELDCKIDGDRVHFLRRVHNTLLGPVAMRWAGSSKPVNRTNTLMWEAPNTIHSVLELQNEETHATIHMEHIMTPRTSASTHYFLNWVRDFGTDNVGYPTDEDVRREQTAVVCGEDIPMVEAQQRNIEAFGTVYDNPSRQDGFVTAVHHTLNQIYAGASKPVPAELRRTSRRTVMVGLLALGLSAFAVKPAAQAQISPADWPQRAVRFILPFGPGSGTDVAARLVGDRLASVWNKPVIVDNRPGGDNLIAINAFVTANDDHTLLFTSSAAFLAHPYVHEKLSYNIERDMAPIARISDTVLVAAVPSSSDIMSIAQFVEQAGGAPEKFNLSGATGLPEFAIDAFLKQRQLKSARVPYRDVVGAARDLGEGRIQFLLTSYAVVRPFVEAGKIRILAAGSRERTAMVKDVPSFPEAGFTDLAVETSLCFFGPKEMSSDLRKRIAADMIAVVNEAKISAQIVSTGQQPNPGGPEELAVALKRQADNTAAIAKILGMELRK